MDQENLSEEQSCRGERRNQGYAVNTLGCEKKCIAVAGLFVTQPIHAPRMVGANYYISY